MKKRPKILMDLSAGDRVATVTGRSDIKVMAIVEGYVVARYMGCAPFVDSIEQFNARLHHVAKHFNKE